MRGDAGDCCPGQNCTKEGGRGQGVGAGLSARQDGGVSGVSSSCGARVEHILGGLEKDDKTGAISTNPENHDLMTRKRQAKIDAIPVPDLEVLGDKEDAELLIVGFGGTYGHLHAAMDELRAKGKKVALAHFRYINPLPKNTSEVLLKYPKVVVAEQNMGQLAGWLRMKVDGFVPMKFNQVKGQPFVVNELVEAFTQIINK